MPFYTTLHPERVDFEDPIHAADVDYLVSYAQAQVLQCSSPVNDATWQLLNARFFRHRPEVELRVYGFYTQPCDLSFASRMGNVRRFSADCLLQASGVEHVADIPNLRSLSIGIFSLDSFDFLQRVSPALEKLFLGATKSKKPDLRPLARFAGLRAVYLEGQEKGIEVLAELAGLEEVTLRSISTPDLSYLRALPKLWSLDIKLGGIHDLWAIQGKQQIKYLELWQIRELRDIGVISHLPGLQNLFLQSLPLITAVPSLREAHKLRRVCLQNLKGLRDLSELERAPALEEFILVQGEGQQPEDLLPALRNPGLRRASAGFGSRQKENRFAQLLREHGVEQWQVTPFQYR